MKCSQSPGGSGRPALPMISLPALARSARGSPPGIGPGTIDGRSIARIMQRDQPESAFSACGLYQGGACSACVEFGRTGCGF